MMAGAVLATCVVSLAWGERITINQGQGWDGLEYVRWARNVPAIIDSGLTRFHSQRVLPSVIVHDALKLLDVTRTTPHIITAFAILNTIVLAASAAIWAHLGHALKLSRPAIWVGFVALFVSHANLKHALYYPTLTDPTAFLLGVLLVWSYLTDRPIVLALTTLAGVVTWPALPPLGVVLLVFPRPSEPVPADDRWPRLRLVAAACISIALAVVFALAAHHYMNHPVRGVGDEKFAAWVLRDWLPVTFALLVAMLAGGWFMLVREAVLWRSDAYLRRMRIVRTLLAVLAAAAIIGFRAWWIAHLGRKGPGPTNEQFMCEHTLAAIRGPLWGPVHHVVYFGPIVLVAMLAWRKIARLVNSWGPGATLAFALVVAFGAGSNSRQWNHLVPFFVTATVAVTSDVWTHKRVLAFAALALVWSKVWFTLGYDRALKFHEFPNQRYFMNHGPYASNTMFLVHLGATLVTLLCVWLLLRTPSSKAEAGPRASVVRR